MTKLSNNRREECQLKIIDEMHHRGFLADVTRGNIPNTDIRCSNQERTKFVHLIVKTFLPGSRTCIVGPKAEIYFGDNFFWILGGIPLHASGLKSIFYFIPSKIISENNKAGHELWLKTPGKKGRPHMDNNVRTIEIPPYKSIFGWDICEYKSRWDLIEEKLK